MLPELDLHGVYYEHVERKVEDFVLACDFPCRIITGNSQPMKELVTGVLERYGFQHEVESYYNLGAIIVTDIPR